MRRLFLLFALTLATSRTATAQSLTLVTSTVKDPSGTPYAFGTYAISFSNPTTQQALYGGVPLPPSQMLYTGQLDINGNLSVTLPSNAIITPSGTQWTFKVCANTSQIAMIYPPPPLPCFLSTQTISGSTQAITLTGATIPQVSSLGATRSIIGGTDVELQAAIAAAGNGGTVIVLPGPSLTLSSTITITHALHLIIESHLSSTADPIFSLTGTGGILIEGGGDGPTGKLVSDAAPTITQATNGAKMMTVGDGVAALRGGIVENLRFVATTNSATSTFQLNANIGDFKFRHLFISGASFDGTAGNYTRVSFDHVRIDSAQNQAWNFQCAIGCVADWNNTYANATGGSPSIGYDLGGAGGVTGSFTSCYADSNSQAFRIKGNIRITNCETESNTGDGINIVGGGLITINGYRSFQDQLPVVMNATGATVIIDGIRTQNTGGANSITVLGSDSVMRVNSYEQLDKAPVATSPGKLVITFKPGLFSSLLACSAGLEGSEAVVTDSTTATYAATITGTGANHVRGYCNGTNWVVD